MCQPHGPSGESILLSTINLHPIRDAESVKTEYWRGTSTFLLDEQGRRPVFGGTVRLQTVPHWRDYILFYECYHKDNGSGTGASDQNGWTGTVARLIQIHRHFDPGDLQEGGWMRPVTKACRE